MSARLSALLMLLLAIFQSSDAKAIQRQDCNSTITRPSDAYGLGSRILVRVVVHVLHDSLDGFLKRECVASGISHMNEFFNGTRGGVDTQIEFRLATTDPAGKLTDGIVYHNNSFWRKNLTAGSHATVWDPSRYSNIWLGDPQNWRAAAAALPPYDIDCVDCNIPDIADGISLQGISWGDCMPPPNPLFSCPGWDQLRLNTSDQYHYTGSHEMAHYLGLFHIFQGNKASQKCLPTEKPACYSTGDLICDTPPIEPSLGALYGENILEPCAAIVNNCTVESKYWCGGQAPQVSNLMSYSPTGCYKGFTSEQAMRMRCVLMAWRADIVIGTSLV